MTDDSLLGQLQSLREGQSVTVVDNTGARFTGSVLAKRPSVDQDDEVGLRRSTGTCHWIKFDRIVALER